MIGLRDLHKSFDGSPVLRGITCDVATGESLVVIGGSGAGKSVLLRCILGLTPLDSGQVIWNGAPLTDRTAFLSRFGMLFQGAALFDSLPVWRNVSFRLLHEGMSAQEAQRIAVEKLALVGLDADVAGRYPAALSGGMQKRVGLARAIAADPDVIFFDEPTAGLDPARARQINTLIRQLIDQTKATAITITHDIHTMTEVSDKVAFLHDGALGYHGDVAGIEASGNAALMAFLGRNT